MLVCYICTCRNGIEDVSALEEVVVGWTMVHGKKAAYGTVMVANVLLIINTVMT